VIKDIIGGCNVVWSENLKERDHMEDLGVNGNIILKCNLLDLTVSGLDGSRSRLWRGRFS
jgi:hypothetical protein